MEKEQNLGKCEGVEEFSRLQKITGIEMSKCRYFSLKPSGPQTHQDIR